MGDDFLKLVGWWNIVPSIFLRFLVEQVIETYSCVVGGRYSLRIQGVELRVNAYCCIWVDV